MDKEEVTSGIQYWPVFLLASNEHVGCCGLRPYPSELRVFELGFHLRRIHRGQAFAVEAARAVIEYAFTTLDATGLFAGHQPANDASQRVLNILGFLYTHDEFYLQTGCIIRHIDYRRKRKRRSEPDKYYLIPCPALNQKEPKACLKSSI